MKHLTVLVAIIMAFILPQTINAHTRVAYAPGESSFSVETNEDAQQVTLRIYDNGMGGKPTKTVNMTKSNANLWQATVKGNLKGKFYTFDVKYGGKFCGECAGIWATAVGVNGKRGAIIDMSETDPADWDIDTRPNIAAKDLIIYEMHHRDFSIDPSSGIEHKGKFLALTESRAIEHLKALGVNAVHILPSFDYASVDETRLNEPQYNWGYDPVNYNVPEGGYSMYNHTWNIDGSNFQLTRPDYYYRKNADGSYSNGSGCGNETASEREGMRQFMIESVKYWVEEYHIDGFRFDLMGVHDIETMNAIRKAVPNDIFIYGEGWSAGSCALPSEKLGMKANITRMPGIAVFSDEIRDALRGPWDSNKKPAFLGGIRGNEESIKFGIVGAIQHPDVDYSKVNYSKAPYASQPTQMIAYVSCHDDMCLVDRLKASIPKISEEELIRLDLLAQTVVMTSQGVPFMLSGEEMLRDKKGVHNSYESPDEINHLDWRNLERHPEVMEYYSNLIAMRKAHPAFHMGNADMVRENLNFLPIKQNFVAFHINGRNVPGEKWGDIYVAFNANKIARSLEVPNGTYSIVCYKSSCTPNGGINTVIVDGKINIPPQSALILHN